MNYTKEDILVEREKRVSFQEELLDRFDKTLVFIRVNYPGIMKDNSTSQGIIMVMDKLLDAMFGSVNVFKLITITAEGPNITMILDKESLEVKKMCVEIEDNHPLGRCVDIDVYSGDDKKSISRKILGKAPRRCFICDENAMICVRSENHEFKDVVDYIEKSYKWFKGAVNEG
ncbi:citrate lyase holo-[acyl-carrier protein] synthase [Clostridium algidicarnis]|uniref:citrate lyase holo-[acyl-carrier protein] synthase n=1 Tax=Clostridium algidicarnis TaxID=37659 RepID=UPI001623DA08|nr:citrate lyase holo-[acyl-carrier protein] synthase [Clostridium algidicarnis]MBB6698119.1 citrate lyase holo-[acyl-carrier protein] synthase [Clostridium algidicarnis]